MTDTELLHEVEQAMLGAMITRPRRVGGLSGPVSPELFTDSRHQAIAAALTGTAGSEHGLLGRLRGFFARFSRRNREDQAYLETLPGLCPNGVHMQNYFDILTEARDQRETRAREAMAQAADAAKVLRGAADQLSVQTAGTGRVTAPGELSENVARQARALAGHAQRLSKEASEAPFEMEGRRRQAAPAPAPQNQPSARRAVAPQAANGRTAPGHGQAGEPLNGQGLSALFTLPPQGPAQPDGPALAKPGPAPAPATREEAQDLLLAALMRDAGFAREAVASLPAELFDDGERRELFMMISEHVSAKKPVDPLIMAWVADQRTSSGPDGERNGWITPDYVRGVATLPPAPGNPAWLSQMLLNGDTNTPAPDQPKAPAAEPSSQSAPDSGSEPAKPSTPNQPAAPQPNRVPVGLAPAPELMEMQQPGPDHSGPTPQM